MTYLLILYKPNDPSGGTGDWQCMWRSRDDAMAAYDKWWLVPGERKVLVEINPTVPTWRVIESELKVKTPETVVTFVHMPHVVARLFRVSTSEARRCIIQGGVKINGVPERRLDLLLDDIDKKYVSLGRRRHAWIDTDADDAWVAQAGGIV